MKTIFGLFDNQDQANNAIDSLQAAGYNPQDFSIIVRDAGETDVGQSKGENVAQGTGKGAVTGGIIGALAGLLVGIGAIVIPGLGALLIGGPLAAAFGISGAAAVTVEGALTGALAGGLVGALVGLGVPEEQAKIYEETIRSGGILLAVNAEDQKEGNVKSTLEDAGATNVSSVNAEQSNKTNA